MSELEKKQVGVELPGETHYYLALSAYYFGTSKSHLIRNALNEWKENNSMSSDDMIKNIKREIQMEWNKFKNRENVVNNVEKTLDRFKEKQKMQMQKNGFPESVIDEILNDLS